MFRAATTMLRGPNGIVRGPGDMFRAPASIVRGARLGPRLNARVLTPARSSSDLVLGDRTPISYDDGCSFLWIGTWSFASSGRTSRTARVSGPFVSFRGYLAVSCTFTVFVALVLLAVLGNERPTISGDLVLIAADRIDKLTNPKDLQVLADVAVMSTDGNR